MCALSVEPQILKTKLYPPRLPEIVTRKRLNSELAKARSCKLAVILAGAGYGKSTLVAEFLQKLRSPFIWYQLDSTDGDLSVFLSYLIAGLRSIHPEFGGKTLSHLASATNITEQSRAILSILITELDELVAEELFIALDDFHLVNDSAQITEAVEFLLDHMLPNLHLIILSRSALSLDLTDLKVRRELLELKEANLRFTHPEIAALFQDIFDMPLSEDDITALSKSTEGWISGLVLFYLALKDKTRDEVSQAIRETGLSLSDVFDYLSKAAYENQPQAVRDFTTHTSILSRMNPAFCDQLLGINDSKGILSYLIDERLFTIPLDDHGNWYRYHQGLRAFLNKTIIDTLSADVIKGMHLRAAALWEENEEPEEALHHYMEAGDYDKAAEVLEKIATELIQAKRISFLYTEISRLPEDVMQRHPIIALHYANVAATFGDMSRSLAAIRDASEEFEKMGDKEKQAQSLLTLASLLIAVMRFDEGIEVLSKARDTMPTDSAYYYELRAVEGMVFAHTEHLIDAYQPLEEALSQADGFMETDMVGRLLGWCGVTLITLGKLHKSIEVLEVEYNLLQRAGLAATNLINRAESSRVYIWLDRLEEAKKVAEEGIALGEEYGLTPMVFFCRAARAVTWAYKGERDRALEDASIAAAMCLNYERNA